MTNNENLRKEDIYQLEDVILIFFQIGNQIPNVFSIRPIFSISWNSVQ